MADALCGPSNPLQNFQKHASIDRTLERDRLISRQSPKESFRSPNPHAGVLSAEFEAFLAGEPVVEPFLPRQDWQNHNLNPVHPNISPQQAPDWVLDFQNLHVKEQRATPFPSAQYREEAPLQRSSSGPWEREFLQRNQPQSFHSQQSRLGQGNVGFGMHASNFGPISSQYTGPIAEQQAGKQAIDSFDEEAFEKAFDAARSELQEHQTDIQNQDIKENPRSTVVFSDAEGRLEYRIGSDRILDDSLQRQERSDAQEADELSRTAGYLLENVKHDQSAKFQGSNFLSLMRQLRDKEVKVEGDNIVQAEQSLHPGGPGYPNYMESLPVEEEIERPMPTTGRIRASSVPRRPYRGPDIDILTRQKQQMI
ncbi:MAG: hypothetical protein Q9170_001710 [Blastenia crenularia]